jgi:nitrate/nitrite transporter NarK
VRYLPTDLIEVTERKSAIATVILSYSLATAMAALLVIVCLPNQNKQNIPNSMPKKTLLTVLNRPVVWLKALIIFCAYCGYKGLDNYGLYVHEVLNVSEMESAKFMAYMAFLRPVAAVLAGFLADRFLASSVIKWSFLLSSAGYIGNIIVSGQIALANIIFVTLMITFLTVFALRGVYFALLAETQTPARLTGTTVGIISVIGYSPDIFFSPFAGRILDAFPGAQGYTYYFSLLTLISLTGLLTTIILIKKINKGRV